MIKTYFEYNDIFKQISKNPNPLSVHAKSIRGVISNHRYNAIKSHGFVRQWNYFQANRLEDKLNRVLKGGK